MCVSYKKKNGSAVFQLPTLRMIPSSAEEFASVSYHKARVNVALCVLIRNYSRLSYLVIASEMMRYESLRADKRKTARPFFDSRLLIRLRAVVVRGTSVYRSLPYFCFAKIRSRFAKIRHGIRAVH